MAIIFFLLGLYCYIIYPSWYLPAPVWFRIAYLNVVLIALLILTRFFCHLLGKHQNVKAGSDLTAMKLKPYLIVSLICFLLHLFQINYPILTGLDSHLHTGLPAALVFKTNQLILNYTNGYLNVHVLSWFLLLLIFVSVWRGKKWITRIRTLRLRSKGLIVLFVAVIVLSNLYGMALIKSGALEELGDISLIHRYPALGRSLFFAGYSLLGIHEWVGRLLQIGFTFAGGFFLARIVQFYKKDRILSLAVYTLYIFLPPLFNVLLLNHLTAGVIFFFIAIHFYFLRYRQWGSVRDLGLLILLLSAGFMYKRPVLMAILMIWLYLILIPRDRTELLWRRIKTALKITAIPAGFIFPYLLICFHFEFSALTGFYLDRIVHPGRFLVSFLIIPFAITTPVFLLFIGSLIFSLVKLKKRTEIRLFFLWFLSYYLFTRLVSTNSIRNMLPFFPAIILMITIFLYHIAQRLKKFARVFFCASCSVILVLFIHLGLFEEDTQFVTLSNKKYWLLPYDKAIRYVAENLDLNKRIYAPMICEPSHFYLAKYGIIDEVYYFRRIWTNLGAQTLDSLYQFCRENNFAYLIFPRPAPRRHISHQDFYDRHKHLGLRERPHSSGDWFRGKIKDGLVEELFMGRDPRFEKIKKFTRGASQIGIFKVVN